MVRYFKLVPGGSDRMGFRAEVKREMTLDLEVREHVYHILDYSWRGAGPRMTLGQVGGKGGFLDYTGDPFSIDPTELDEISFRFSTGVNCVGRFEDGGHIPCPGYRSADEFAQCMECLTIDIPDPACVFEPHCNRGSCGAFFCQKPHVVYISLFGTRPKVGMTQLDRILDRGTEQGADLIVPLLEAGDRYSARAIEGAISRKLRVPQAHHPATLLKAMSRKRDTNRAEVIVNGLIRRVKDSWTYLLRSVEDLKVVSGPSEFDIEVFELGPYPLQEPLPYPPKMFRGSLLNGRVLGFKGKYMVFEHGGLKAFNLASAVGRFVHSRTDLSVFGMDPE